MSKTFFYIAAAFALAAWLGWSGSHNLFTASGYGFWAAILCGQFFLSQPNSALQMDNPPATVYPVDLDTAMYAVRSALVNSQHNGIHWRLLDFEPDVGALVGSLDLVEQAAPNAESADHRTKVLLFAEFEQRPAGTLVRLRWRVRSGLQRKLSNSIIRFLTGRIQYEMLGIKAFETNQR